MAWLVLGLSALMAAALWPERLVVARVAAAACAALFFALAFWIYPPDRVLLAGAAATAAGLLARPAARRIRGTIAVPGLTVAGLGAGLFALFGPAEGLF